MFDCVLQVAVHRAIYISMLGSLVKVNMKLLQPLQTPSLGLFAMTFFLTPIHPVLMKLYYVTILSHVDSNSGINV